MVYLRLPSAMDVHTQLSCSLGYSDSGFPPAPLPPYAILPVNEGDTQEGGLPTGIHQFLFHLQGLQVQSRQLSSGRKLVPGIFLSYNRSWKCSLSLFHNLLFTWYLMFALPSLNSWSILCIFTLYSLLNHLEILKFSSFFFSITFLYFGLEPHLSRRYLFLPFSCLLSSQRYCR